MDALGGPAALGGLVMCVALGAWVLGRWQAGAAAAPDACATRTPEPAASDPPARSAAAPTPAIPCQRAAQAERRGALDVAGSLGDLHAEISAYRRAQQVLADIAAQRLEFPPPRAGHEPQCRYFGVTGQPTCALPDAARRACGGGCRALIGTCVQAPPAESDFTRV